MEKCYRFAGVGILVNIPDERMYTEERFLAPFRVENVQDPHVFRFTVVPKLVPPEGDLTASFPGFRVYSGQRSRIRYTGSVQDSWENAYMRAEHNGKEHVVTLKEDSFPGRIGVHTVLNALEAERLVTQTGGFVFHSSYIAWNGKAILFTAPSETGKSTQADLWRNLRGAQIINGDRSVIRIVNGKVCACGIPFAGSSQYCENEILPLGAIVYLQQAPVTTISRLKGVNAFRRIWEGVTVNTWDSESVDQVSSLVQQVAMQVPVYYMPCTPDESAVIALEQALAQQEG